MPWWCGVAPNRYHPPAPLHRISSVGGTLTLEWQLASVHVGLFVILLSWHPDATRFVLPLTRKVGFRPAGWPLPGGCRTLWTTTKGFRSYAVLLSCPPDAIWYNHIRAAGAMSVT